MKNQICDLCGKNHSIRRNTLCFWVAVLTFTIFPRYRCQYCGLNRRRCNHGFRDGKDASVLIALICSLIVYGSIAFLMIELTNCMFDNRTPAVIFPIRDQL